MITRKEFHAVAAPAVKAVHNALNAYLVGQPFHHVPGHVATWSDEPKGGVVQFEEFTIKIQSLRRSRVVCGVPTPFSLYSFTYALFRDGKSVAFGNTLPDFTSSVFRLLQKEGRAR